MKRKPHKPTQAAPHKQSGFTLIELSIVIAIGLLLILAGLAFGPALMLSSRVSSETQNIGMLISSTRNLYQGRYANLTTAKIIQYNLAPTALVNGTALAGNWGTITLTPGALTGAAANTALQVTLANILQPACIQLAPALLGTADELDVGGSSNLKSANTPNPARDTVTDACGTGGAVSIVIRAM